MKREATPAKLNETPRSSGFQRACEKVSKLKHVSFADVGVVGGDDDADEAIRERVSDAQLDVHGEPTEPWNGLSRGKKLGVGVNENFPRERKATGREFFQENFYLAHG